MKKQLMRVVPVNLANRFFKASAFAILLTIAAPSAFASANPDPGVKDAKITHVATTNDNLLFEVRVANENSEKFTLIIKDEVGTTLYRGVYSEKDFAKKFQFPKQDLGKLTFTIKTSEGNRTESFEINSNTRLVEEVVVKRVG